MKHISNKWNKYKIINNKDVKSTKSKKTIRYKNFRQKIIYGFDLNNKIPLYYKATSSQQIPRFKLMANLKHYSHNMEINKNGNMENISMNFKNKIKIKPNSGEIDNSISRNNNSILPKIYNNRTIDRKAYNNNSSEKFSSLKYRLEECKKKLFRNNSNWEKVSVNYDYNLRKSQINKRYLK